MTAIQRNNAVQSQSVAEARLGRGGSGRTPLVRAKGKVARRLKPPEDPAAELMPAAEFLGYETDFAAITEAFEGSPFDPARRKILGKLMGMFAMDYQGARPEERRFLRRLLAAGNPREGYAANRALHLCGATPVIRRTLALGVAEARFQSGRVQGFLGAVQARVAATTFRLLGPAGREAIWDLLTRAGHDPSGAAVPGADRTLERALVLKALAARRARLGPWSPSGPAALAEVAAFAEQIRGQGRATLAARTTLVPGDPARQAARAAAIRDPGERALALARAEIDPVFAWEEHERRAERATAKDTAAPADDAFPDLDRGLLIDRPRLHWALAEARVRPAGRLGVEEADALTDYICGRSLRDARVPHKDAAIATLLARGFDVVRPEAIEAIRQDVQGIYRFDAARALGDLLSRYTGATYVRRVFSDQLTAGLDPVGQIGTALERGLCVPIVVAELKLPVSRAFAAHGTIGEPPGVWELLLLEPQAKIEHRLSSKGLLAPVLPEAFGQKARADAYLAPAALDLLAPPFGIPFPEIGIDDRL